MDRKVARTSTMARAIAALSTTDFLECLPRNSNSIRYGSISNSLPLSSLLDNQQVKAIEINFTENIQEKSYEIFFSTS